MKALLPFLFAVLSLVKLIYLFERPTMAAELVGGAFLSASLDLLFERMAWKEVIDFVRWKKLNQELLNKLNDAEKKQLTDPRGEAVASLPQRCNLWCRELGVRDQHWSSAMRVGIGSIYSMEKSKALQVNFVVVAV